jgi:hypothetical protein
MEPSAPVRIEAAGCERAQKSVKAQLPINCNWAKSLWLADSAWLSLFKVRCPPYVGHPVKLRFGQFSADGDANPRQAHRRNDGH